MSQTYLSYGQGKLLVVSLGTYEIQACNHRLVRTSMCLPQKLTGIESNPDISIKLRAPLQAGCRFSFF